VLAGWRRQRSEINRRDDGIAVRAGYHVLSGGRPSVDRDREIGIEKGTDRPILRAAPGAIAPDYGACCVEVEIVIEHLRATAHVTGCVCGGVAQAQIDGDGPRQSHANEDQRSSRVEWGSAEYVVAPEANAGVG